MYTALMVLIAASTAMAIGGALMGQEPKEAVQGRGNLAMPLVLVMAGDSGAAA